MTEESLVQAILAEPEDHERYLVFADWLDEQGEEARARLLRGRIKLQSCLGSDPSRQALLEEMKQLQSEIESSWPAYCTWGQFFAIRWDKGLPDTAFPKGDLPSESVLRSLPAFPYLRLGHASELPSLGQAELLIKHTVLLTLSVLMCLNEEGFRFLGQLSGLKGLQLPYRPTLTDDQLAHLAPLGQLRSLTLRGEGITDAGLTHLRGFRNLERLSLEDTRLTDDGLKSLLGFRGLKGRLKRLDLGGTRITAKALSLLVRCKQLRSLSLRGVEAINDTNVMRLARLHELRELDLSLTGVTRDRLRRLAEFPKLDRIRTQASLARWGEREETREVEALLKDMQKAELFIEVDYE